MSTAEGKPNPEWPRVRGLLIRGVNWLGDAVMTTPALLRLREAWPDTAITLLTPAKLEALWTEHPAIDAVEAVQPGEGVWSVARRLRAQRFDAALIFPNSHRAALEMWLARIPRRVGRAVPWRSWLLTDAVPPRPGEVRMKKRTPAEIRRLVSGEATTPASIPGAAHQVHHYLHLAARLGARVDPVPPRLEVRDARVAAARSRFGLGPERRWLALNPGAAYGPAKRWPADRFAEAAAVWMGRSAARGCVVLGGAADREVAQAVLDGVRQRVGGAAPERVVALTGRLTLGELCATLRCCGVLLTNDSGPMHVAAALGVPVVAVFGSTAPELTGPGLPGAGPHRLVVAQVPCRPCYRRACPIDFRCMLGLTTDAVVRALDAMGGE